MAWQDDLVKVLGDEVWCICCGRWNPKDLASRSYLGPDGNSWRCAWDRNVSRFNSDAYIKCRTRWKLDSDGAQDDIYEPEI